MKSVILPSENKINAYYFDSLVSTNTYVLENAEKMRDLDVVITLNQTGGRGRYDRVFISENQSLCMSLLLKQPPNSLFPIHAGLAVYQALTSLFPAQFTLKWPNDVLINGKKICGILCESRFSENPFTVIGIGVNLYQNKDFFNKQNFSASSIFTETGENCDFLLVAAKILDALIDSIRNFESNPENLIKDYSNVCITLEKSVNIIKNGKNQEGFAISINNDGSLKTSFSGVIEDVYSEIF